MANVLTKALDALGMFAWTIWGLQERRFLTAFDAMSSAMVSVTKSFIVCFVSINSHTQPHFSYAYSAMLYIQS